MKKLLFSLLVMVLIVGLSEAVIYACGAKFLVSAKSSPALLRVKANTEPTTVLVYWQQDDQTPEEDKWRDSGTNVLEEVGHTVTVMMTADSFLAAARDGDFEVLMVKPFEEAQRLKDQIAAIAPDSVLLPVIWTPTRSERMAAEREFGRVLQMPSTPVDFLTTLDKAGRVR